MKEIVAIACVVSWAGFWAFGYLALSAQNFDSMQVLVALLIASAGFLSGIFTYLRLSREET